MCPPKDRPRSLAELLLSLVYRGELDDVFRKMDERRREREDQMDWLDYVGA